MILVSLYFLLEKKLNSLKIVDFGNAFHCVHDELSLYYDDFELQTLVYRAPEVRCICQRNTRLEQVTLLEGRHDGLIFVIELFVNDCRWAKI